MKTILFKPFEKFSTNSLLLVGLVMTILGSYLGYLFNARYDGVLDLHFGHDVPFWNPFIENAVNIFCLSLFLLIIGWIVNKKTRFIDILVTVLVARMTFYVLPFLNVKDFLSNSADAVLTAAKDGSIENIPLFDLGLLIGTGIVTLLFLVWYIALLFNGFKVASNAKGTNRVILFCGAILFAEILSKLFIHLIL